MNVDSYSYCLHEYSFIYRLLRTEGLGMPKETFFNLPEEKRERIINAAIDEFATYPFYQARVTAIAEQAGIAKGSFYQYFEDKKDLFKYLMELSVEKKMSYISHDVVEGKGKYGFFQLLREVYLSGIRFAKDNPRLRSEEHTSELQSRPHLVCRLLLEKKKKKEHKYNTATDNS